MHGQQNIKKILKYSTCFGQFLCPSSGVFHCTHGNGIYHTGLLASRIRTELVPFWSCSQAVTKPVWHTPLLCVQWRTPDDGQRNCPKHVEFYSKNKFEILVYLVGFIIRIHRSLPATSSPTCLMNPSCTWSTFCACTYICKQSLSWEKKKTFPTKAFKQL